MNLGFSHTLCSFHMHAPDVCSLAVPSFNSGFSMYFLSSVPGLKTRHFHVQKDNLRKSGQQLNVLLQHAATLSASASCRSGAGKRTCKSCCALAGKFYPGRSPPQLFSLQPSADMSTCLPSVPTKTWQASVFGTLQGTANFQL